MEVTVADRAGLPEASGGALGCDELVAVLADPDNPLHDEKLEWVGRTFDPEQFDVRASIQALKLMCARAQFETISSAWLALPSPSPSHR